MVEVLLPRGHESAAGEGMAAVLWEDSGQLCRQIRERRSARIVVVTEGLEKADEEAVAAAILESGARVVEVRWGPWDGRTASPVSAACRGVVTGFGEAGLRAAVRLLEKEEESS